MSDNFDAIRENILQVAQEHYTDDSPERTAFIAGAGYMLSQHMGTMNPVALEHGKTVHTERAEVRQYTANNEDEIAQWIVESTYHQISVAIIFNTLHFGKQQAEYGDFIERSADNKFTVHRKND